MIEIFHRALIAGAIALLAGLIGAWLYERAQLPDDKEDKDRFY